MSNTVTVSKDEIGEKAFDIATLIGLLDENGNLQTDWFSSPLTHLEAAPGRAKTLIQSIQSFLAPRSETNAPVFTGAEWYEIRNPSTGNATGFYVVTPQAADAGGLVGLGIQHAIAVGNLSIDFYAFIPVFRINNGGEPDFVLIDTTNPGKVSPVRVGFDVSSTVPLDAGNGGTFIDFKVEVDISLDGKASDLFALTIAFTGGTMNEGDTYHSLTNFIDASTTGDRMATLIVQGMSYWLNLYIGDSEHTVGDVLVNANLLGTGTSGDFTYYSYDANALRKIKADPLKAAEDILFGVLEVLADNETPLIPLPFLDPEAQGDGGVYIAEIERNGAKDYGLRIVAEIPLISGNGTGGKPQAAGDVCFGTWLTGETSGNNWIERLLAADGRLDDFALAVLQRQDFFLHRVARDELVAGHDLGLADAMRAVGGLVFHRRIPPRIEMNHRVRARQVQAHAAGFQADEKHRDRGVALKSLHHRAAIGGRAVEVTELNVFRRELLLEQRQHAHELAEDQHAMAAVDDFLQQFAEHLQFAGGVRRD